MYARVPDEGSRLPLKKGDKLGPAEGRPVTKEEKGRA